MSAHTSDFAQLGYSLSPMAVWALGLQVMLHKITLSTSQLKKKSTEKSSLRKHVKNVQ